MAMGIQTITSLPSHHMNLHFLPRRRIRTLLPNLLALEVEPHRHGNQGHSYTPQQGSRPLNAHALEHLAGEERERSAR